MKLVFHITPCIEIDRSGDGIGITFPPAIQGYFSIEIRSHLIVEVTRCVIQRVDLIL